MAITHAEFYAAANLVNNPFRSNPALEMDPRMAIWVSYKDEQDKLKKYLRRSLSDEIGNQNMVLIFGGYGTGKSHALLWSQYYVSQLCKDEFNSMSFYIKTLKKSKGLMTFLGAFQEDIVSRSCIVQDILAYKQFLGLRIIEYMDSKGIQPGSGVNNNTILKQIIKSTDLVNLAQDIMVCDDENQVGDLLSPKNDFEALMLFTRLTNLFVYKFEMAQGERRFRKAVYLFIDELDRLGFSSLKEARDTNDMLVHLYDQCSECFYIGLAAMATPAELNILFSPAVVERIGNKKIELGFMQPSDAKQFIKELLDTARVNSSTNTGFFPFTEECIDSVIAGLVSITPRKIVDRMLQILEEARLVDINPTAGLITTAMLDSHHVWEQVG